MVNGLLAFWLFDLLSPETWWSSPWLLLLGAFQLWMLVDAVRREEWMWVVFIVIFPLINAVLYYFLVYRAAPSATRGFELPGAHDRRRIKELEAQIHHLDKAHHHSQLGDIYFQQGKLDKAEACYRAARERDAEDLDTQAHYGQCLLRQKRPAAALPLLEKVCREKPDHDYGHSLMALAETYTAVGRQPEAIATWQRVLDQHTYARARVQLAELYLVAHQPAEARRILAEAISDDAHAPAFQRKREKYWVRRARSLARQAGG
jgi:hypothetical protein